MKECIHSFMHPLIHPFLHSFIPFLLPGLIPHKTRARARRHLHNVHTKGIALLHERVDVGHAGRGFLEDGYPRGLSCLEEVGGLVNAAAGMALKKIQPTHLPTHISTYLS